jgi:hypothetical protein
MEGKYIYGIINASEGKRFSKGITGNKELYTISHQDISAIVSDSHPLDYIPSARGVCGVIRKVVETCPAVIPVKSVTCSVTKEEIEEILVRGARRFKDILQRIDNKVELEISATWHDLKLIIKELSEEEDVKRLRERLLSSPNSVTAEDHIMLGAKISHLLHRKNKKTAEEIEERLRGLSISFRRHNHADSRMIFKSSFLVERDKKARLESKLEDIKESYKERIDFNCIGPLPAYSFYAVEVKKVSYRDVELARECLGLDDGVTTRERIEKAYIKSILSYQSNVDRYSSTGAETLFDRLKNAYNLLLECCQSIERFGNNEEDCLFVNDPDRTFVLVKIKNGAGSFYYLDSATGF